MTATESAEGRPLPRVIAIANQKGGVGKTTVTLGLASAAARAGRHVLVVDLDPQGSSTWVLGHDPASDQPSTADVIGTSGGEMTIVASHWGPEVDVVASSPSLSAGRRAPAEGSAEGSEDGGSRNAGGLVNAAGTRPILTLPKAAP